MIAVDHFLEVWIWNFLKFKAFSTVWTQYYPLNSIQPMQHAEFDGDHRSSRVQWSGDMQGWQLAVSSVLSFSPEERLQVIWLHHPMHPERTSRELLSKQSFGQIKAALWSRCIDSGWQSLGDLWVVEWFRFGSRFRPITVHSFWTFILLSLIDIVYSYSRVFMSICRQDDVADYSRPLG